MSDQKSNPAWEYSDAFFKNVLRMVVPERRKDIDDLLGRHGIIISADQAEDSLRFCVDLGTHEITVATAPLPRIWAHGYAYLSLYEIMFEMRAEDSQAREVTTANERFAKAMAVLKWAMKKDAEAKVGSEAAAMGPQAYPVNMALPSEPRTSDSTHKVASDLTMMALGLVLLHEIAHLELGHCPSEWPDSLAQERAADAWAASFLLDKCDGYAKTHGHSVASVQRKRLLALVIGELWALHFEVHLGVKNSQTHPPSYDRLSVLLDQHAEDKADVAWTMAATVLSLHYQARYGISEASIVFGDSRECYQHYADLLSKKPRRDF